MRSWRECGRASYAAAAAGYLTLPVRSECCVACLQASDPDRPCDLKVLSSRPSAISWRKEELRYACHHECGHRIHGFGRTHAILPLHSSFVLQDRSLGPHSQRSVFCESVASRRE